MRIPSLVRHGGLSIIIAAVATATLAIPNPVRAATADAKPDAVEAPAGNRAEIPARIITMSMGQGQLVRLARPMTNLFVADDKIADVQVKGSTALYLFGKAAGETTIYATDRTGAVIWSSNVRVGNNITTVGAMLKAAMPEADITAMPVGNMVLLTGTVLGPKDIDEAQRLVETFTAGAPVINRLHAATPMQVNLRVKIAEVSRDLVKAVGVNLMSRDQSGGFLFGVAQGRSFGSIGDLDISKLPTAQIPGPNGGTVSVPYNPFTGQFVNPLRPGTSYNLDKLGQGAGRTSLGLAGKFLGMDLASAIDLAETDGLVTTLAEPNLTALSGETASFLAGGEIPIPIAQGLGQVSVEFKQYGVSLSFTPTVMRDGRISLRVRPEVSQLTTAGTVTLNGFSIPGLTTRRAETTVELGSGQAFMIGGLLNNNINNSTDKVPGIGSLPIIGALFRSNSFRRQQTELVIVVTPYLVKPVDASEIKLPTDGFKAPTDAERWLLGKSFNGTSGAQSPKPVAAGATAAAEGK
ncbi:type II and III secretion system protein family protein [uncultured Sphingomonas sp.]|uniref:type II and III secretion system protein family protein n=1 Tax=uncultured Sphingomonas sp. TaxID=158754 RepID=UPI0025F37601|nr:type II and III secretion system protein family protein [uncultured Sphingomonas sp.]